MKYGPKRRALDEKTAATPASTRVWKALADPTRRRIFEKLANGASQVGDLASGLPVTRSAVSQHLRVMLEVGLVTQERVGRENRYRLHPERLNEVRGWLAQLDASWGNALSRLGQHLERSP